MDQRSCCLSCVIGLDTEVVAFIVSLVDFYGVVLMEVYCVRYQEEDELQLDDLDCCSNEAARRWASPTIDGSNCAIEF